MKINRLTLIALFAVCVGLFAARPVGYGVGDVVADFKLKNIDGSYRSLADYKGGKGVILIFDCNTCPVSKGYNERILALNEKFATKGFPVLLVNSNSPEVSPGDSFDEMVSYAKKKKYTFSYLADENQEVATAFGASNTPHTFVLKKEGDKFKVAYIGAIDNNSRDGSAADKKYVEDAVSAILEGKEVPVAKTKAIGCTIKWKNP